MKDLFGGDYYMAMSRGARGLLARIQWPLLFALLIYKALNVCIVTPILQGIWSVALRLAPDNYITPDNLRTMLRSPVTLVALLLMAVLFCLWTLYEFALIICGLSYARRGIRCKLIPLLRDAGSRVLPALQPRNWLVLILVAFLVPVASIFSDFGLVTRISIPYYIYEVIVGKTLTAGLYWLFRAVLVLLTLRWLLTVHYFILERRTFREARRESAAWLMENPRRSLTGLLRWALRVVVLMAALYGIMILLCMVALVIVGMQHENAMYYLWDACRAIAYPFLVYVAGCLGTIMQQSYISAEYYNRIEGEPLELTGIEDINRGSRRWSLTLVLAICVGMLACTTGIAAMTWYFMEHDSTIEVIYEDNEIQITSHRGYSAAAPENTIPAFEAAIEAGADCAELDVQMTSDGVVVLTHDTNLKRTTGCDANVYDLTYAEVAALDAGSFYSKEFAGTQIPTLDEVIKTCKGRLRLNIEIKSNEHTPTLAAETVRIIRENGFADECVVTSLSYDTLVAVKEADPEITTGYIMPLALGSYYDLPAVDFYSLEGTFVTSNAVWQAHLRGKTVSVWTMDRSNDIRHMINIGVDDLITDDPITARQLVNSRDEIYEQLRSFCAELRDHGLSTAVE